MLSEKPWKTESVVRLMLGVFATLCIGFLAAQAIVSFLPGLSDENSKLLSMALVTVSFHGAALFWIGFFLKAENITWTEAFGFKSPRVLRAAGLAILSAILVLPVAWGLQQLSAWVMETIAVKFGLTHLKPEAQQVVQEIQKGGVSPFQHIYFAVIALIAAPIVEEMLFRGILYPTIKRAGYPKLALWGTSIVFALIHQNIAAFLPLIVFAIILTMLYEDTGNLLAPIIAHSCFNTANFIMLLFAKHFMQLTP